MPRKIRIALDAMGGDQGASVVVPGAEICLARHPDTEFLLFGNRAVVEPLLAARPRLGAAAHHRVAWAARGAAVARVWFEGERPRVGLLSIGVEEVKGLEEVRDASRILREGKLRQIDDAGFVEGDDIGRGTVDVVVTE